MKLFTSSDIKRLDEYTIQREPIASIDLMERAAAMLTQWITARFSPQHAIVVCCGAGNNGGDGLAVARMLSERSYKVQVYLISDPSTFSPDATVSYKRLVDLGFVNINRIKDSLPVIPSTAIVIDALFGSGLNRPLEGIAVKLVQHINSSGATAISIDIPSGLGSDDFSKIETACIIRASYTLTLEFPKLTFMCPENEEFVGDMHVIPIGLHPDGINSISSNYHYITLEDVEGLIHKRKQFSHKGVYGKCLLVAGSAGMAGAAVLAARACYRSGAGLLTVHIPSFLGDVVQTAIPEAIVSLDKVAVYTSAIPDTHFTAAAIGPGMGKHPDTREAFCRFLQTNDQPLVLDADALNILAENDNWVTFLPKNTIITPHPKEFERLVGKWRNSTDRIDKQVRLASVFDMVVVVKGARTTIALPDGSVWFNSTGNPGMATAGSGDVLTGVILALLGQGLSPRNAAILGVYIHGLAGDLAAEKVGEVSLMASDIVDYLPLAFASIAG
ncbi:MAG: NAD(P)H-hydrate dehydratase [Prevotellaceae bacterium]|jgi:NAD(P)H-hydrate epimerase|nr:NAD(P)H-hydrate dehydratase [Prevotellaceae bacterium]